MLFGTYLSNREQANSASLFIPSLSFSARKRLKAKLRFTLVLERALSACRFASLGLYFLFFTAICISSIFSGLNGVESSLPHLCALICWGKHTNSPPRNVPTKPKHQNTGRGQEVMLEPDSFCVSLYLFLGNYH